MIRLGGGVLAGPIPGIRGAGYSFQGVQACRGTGKGFVRRRLRRILPSRLQVGDARFIVTSPALLRRRFVGWQDNP